VCFKLNQRRMHTQGHAIPLQQAHLPSTSCLYIILRSSMTTKSCRSERTRHSGHTASSSDMAVSEDRPAQSQGSTTQQHLIITATSAGAHLFHQPASTQHRQFSLSMSAHTDA
jgi:hypothetical protein